MTLRKYHLGKSEKIIYEKAYIRARDKRCKPSWRCPQCETKMIARKQSIVNGKHQDAIRGGIDLYNDGY